MNINNFFTSTKLNKIELLLIFINFILLEAICIQLPLNYYIWQWNINTQNSLPIFSKYGIFVLILILFGVVVYIKFLKVSDFKFLSTNFFFLVFVAMSLFILALKHDSNWQMTLSYFFLWGIFSIFCKPKKRIHTYYSFIFINIFSFLFFILFVIRERILLRIQTHGFTHFLSQSFFISKPIDIELRLLYAILLSAFFQTILIFCLRLFKKMQNIMNDVKN